MLDKKGIFVLLYFLAAFTCTVAQTTEISSQVKSGEWDMGCHSGYCNSTLFLTCDTKTKYCVCKKEYVVEERVCRSHPETTCNDNSNCTAHATCIGGEHKICKCDPGYKKFYENDRYQCLPLHDVACEVRSPYDTCPTEAGLYCHDLDSVCRCYDVGYEWSAEYSRCLGKAGSYCDSTLGQPACVTNANCIGRICKCIEGFSPTKEGLCQLKWGSSCTPSETELANKCNADEFLECVSSTNTCQCLEGKAIPDENWVEGDCRFVVGQACDKSANDPFKRKCVVNSKCTYDAGSAGYVCKRNEDYVDPQSSHAAVTQLISLYSMTCTFLYMLLCLTQ